MQVQFDEEVETLFGLKHLSGKNVIALADFGVVEDLIVNEDGSVNLPYPAKNVVIGLPYTFKLETLNLEAQGTLGIKKLINKIEIKTLKTREDF